MTLASQNRAATLSLGVFSFIASLLLVGFLPTSVAALTGTIELVQNEAQVRYRNGIEFRLGTQVVGGGQVTSALLKVKFGKRGREESFQIKLTGGAGTQWLDEDNHSLTAGLPLTYWWVLSDGKVQFQTESKSVIYQDTRHTWYQREGPQVTVRWYAGDDAYGSLMYQLAADTLATYKRRFNIDPYDHIYITIYGSGAAYRTAFPEVPAWSGGFARYGGIEIVAIAPQNHNAGIFIGEGIPHELSHAAVYQFLRSPAPRWLDEGFAVYNQNTIDIKEYDELLNRAYQGNALIPLSDLNNRWPSEVSAARLAYAQGRSIVTFFINNYGNEVFANLLDGLRRQDADGAMKEVFGVSLAEMEQLWIGKTLAGRTVKLPAALKRGPVASQPTDPRIGIGATRSPASSGYDPIWLIAGVLAVILLASLSFFTFVLLRRRTQLRRNDAENKEDYEALKSRLGMYAQSPAPYRAPAPIPLKAASQAWPVPTHYAPAPLPVFSGQIPPSLPPLPSGHFSVYPPASPGPIAYPPLPDFPSTNRHFNVPSHSAPATSSDPYDLLFANFGGPPPPKTELTTPKPEQAAPPLRSFLDSDPYGLGFLSERDGKK